MAEPSPRVSAIIPFFNVSPQFLREAVESVRSQTVSSWELILVDDGTTGADRRLADDFARRDGRIRVVQHPGRENLGLSAARQLGIRESRAPCIAFLDADDVWLPTKLEHQLRMLDAHPHADMVYGNALYWYSWTGRADDRRRDYQPDLGVVTNTLIEPPTLLPRFLDGSAAVPCPCSVIVRRRTLQAIGGFEPEFRGMHEDQVFYSKICAMGRIVVSDQCSERYRQHADSICAQAARRGDLFRSRLRFLDWLVGFLSQRGVQDPRVLEVLHRERWLVAHYDTTKRNGDLVRRLKRWVLRFEDHVLSAEARQARWVRRGIRSRPKE